MSMKFVMTATAVLALTGCATVQNETRTPAVISGGFYDGERYEIRKQLIDGPQGTYEKTSVVYRGFSRSCIPDSPNDCESKAERLIESVDESPFVF